MPMKKYLLTIPVLLGWIVLAFLTQFAQTAPPKEANKREADLIELTELDKTLKLDIRYATAENFTGTAVYTEPRAFMQRPAAEALIRVHRKLKKRNLGLVIFDGYRPWSVTKIFWDVTPEDKRKIVIGSAPRWKPKVLPSTTTNGGISITKIGLITRFTIFRFRRSKIQPQDFPNRKKKRRKQSQKDKKSTSKIFFLVLFANFVSFCGYPLSFTADY